jgi:hypothetical protein
VTPASTSIDRAHRDVSLGERLRSIAMCCLTYELACRHLPYTRFVVERKKNETNVVDTSTGCAPGLESSHASQ